jgi:predicted RNA-binding Zn ribbon-like protein
LTPGTLVSDFSSRCPTTLTASPPRPLHLLVPVAESAAWMLERGERSLLRRCENPECVLFFYDSTKNKRRRWCSMDSCGSRAKAAAYYRRHREGAHGLS